MKLKDYDRDMRTTQTTLFTKKDQYLLDHTEYGYSKAIKLLPDRVQQRMRCDNMHLLRNLSFTDENGFPILAPNSTTMDIDVELYSYSNRNKHKSNPWGVHFFRPDTTFLKAVTTGLERTTRSIIDCSVVFAPDFSLYVDSPTPFINQQNVFRSRLAAAYWQECGLNVIQTASWGDANSLKYAFEGLAENTITAVCGIGHDFCKSAQTLWIYAISKLIELKAPSKLVIYGGKRDNIPDFGIPIQFIDDFITKRFRNNGK